MSIRRGFLRASVCGAVLIHAASLTVISGQALAACGTGGQCRITNGTSSTFSNGTYWSTDWDVRGRRIGGVRNGSTSALWAVNPNSTIDASNITIAPRQPLRPWVSWTQGHYDDKAWAENGGQINLTNSTLTGGLRGIHAQGDGAQITMTGGSINVGLNGATVLDTSRLVFNGGVAITVASGVNAVGVEAYGEGTAIFDYANINVTGSGAVAVRGRDNAVLSFGATNINGSGNDARGIEANDKTQVRFFDGTVDVSGDGSRAVIGRGESTLDFQKTNITNTGQGSNGLFVTDDARLTFTDGSIEANGSVNADAVVAMGDSKLAFTASDIKTHGNSGVAIHANGSASVNFTDGTITATGDQGWNVLARDNSEVILESADIIASGYQSNGIGAIDGAKVSFTDGTIAASGDESIAIRGEGSSSQANFDGVKVTASGDGSGGIYLQNGAEARFVNGWIDASGFESVGVVSADQAHLTLEDYNGWARGNNSAAFVFNGAAGAITTPGSTVDMVNGTVFANTQAFAINGQGGTFAHTFNITDSSIGGAHRLVEMQDTSSLNLVANNSTLIGSARTGNDANLAMNLQDSLWVINHDVVGSGHNSISSLNLTNSDIVFNAPLGTPPGRNVDDYQTLHIGAGVPGTSDVYNAGSNSQIEMNMLINAGGVWSNQYTDRLLIDGNVTGRTLLKINEVTGSSGALSSAHGTNAANEGISLVQVSGDARPDSFYIKHGYMTLAGKPYVHRIYAFGPGSAYGDADVTQQQVGGAGNWDYRLQNEFIRNRHGWAAQVVPQVASYLTAPTALFQSSLMNAGNLHNRLGEMRLASVNESGLDEDMQDAQQEKFRGNFFLRGFGGSYDYHSNLSSIQYGYDADIRYGAVQAGGNLYGFDTPNGQMMFGLAGSYGDLSFSPDRVDSQKTSMDVWSASAYASWLGTSGFYIDTVLSYGAFSGAVSTTHHEHTASLKGNSLTASVEVGQNFAIGSDGWSIEPQAQLLYQRLSFDRAHDVDDFAVVLGSPDQWVGRIGGKLSKNVAVESIERLEIYGKLNLTHGISDGDHVFLGDDFRIGEFGTQIEGGLGVNLDMTKNASLYGDASYQGRVGDGGSSGFSLNGGMKFNF